ncbi:guanine nucleotide exchange factor for Rab-3A-like isoform X3 [Portunus trituberculatus]|uniref:guanine nucleotide exchange factor for Rab-3A-like isoform X3 n=1 Tax=Portunus trituberculatus TaxID=210409 RepID=UPI001E1CC3FC|nr:guanine nucleotide exchange factor for Rab-3A-like isoform X3 [Portunus trituberculatus]
MSVVVSAAGMPGSPSASPQEDEASELDGWRQAVRAKVTTLKCHVMASRGLTSDGHIVAPYSPRLLLDAPNARLLLDAASLDLDAYVEALHRADGLLAKGSGGDQNGTAEEDTVSLDDVQLRLQQEAAATAAAPATPATLTNGHALTPASSPAKSLSNGSAKSPPPSPPPSPAPSPLPSPSLSRPSKVAEVNGHGLNGSHEAVNGTLPAGDEAVREELAAARQQLAQKEAEVVRLARIRDEVENELQELTANLFQEAHSMVNSANQRAANAERSLREAEMQVEVLTAEVTALKALVITSTPAAPNPHLHPQLITKSVTETGKKIFQRGHRKSPSDFDLKYGRDTTPPSSPLKESRINDAAGLAQFPLDPECWEVSQSVDPVVHKEFIAWKQNPTLERSNPFMQRIYEEDIDLCLAFPNSVLAHRVQRAIEDNSVFIEEVNPRQKSSCPRKCVLLDVPRFCKYRFRLSESDETWYYISQLARNRIIAICDFLNYLRYIKLGLVKSSVHDVYWEIVKLRRQMALARLGF